MEKRAIRKGLNQSIAEAATEQWGRLTGQNQRIRTNRLNSSLTKAYNKHEYQIYRKRSVENSLRSLDRLKQGDMPDYNDWDALFYLTWYQPRQVNLVYSMLNGLKIDGTDRNILGSDRCKIRVLDFGCGCLATNIAVAIAAADLAAQNYHVPIIEIDNIDISPAMILVGERIWELFQNKMRVPHKHPIRSIFDRVTYKTHSSLSSLGEPSPDTHCYVTAIHCAYEQSHSLVRRNLQDLVRRFNPTGLFLTTHLSKSDILEKVTPRRQMDKQHYELLYNGPIVSWFSGEANKITKWRRTLLENHLRPSESNSPDGVDYDYIRKYLSNPVQWDSNDCEVLMYTHRKMNETSPFNFTGKVDVL